jgi:aspartate aminotransferase
MKLSRLVDQMSESATLRMAQLARDLKEKGNDVISLSLGEPDFDTPDAIKKAASRALDNGYTKYSPVPGMPQLKEAIANKLKRENKLDYDLDQIVVSNGAKQSIANLCMALLNPEDEVILFTPYWVSYKDIVGLTGAKVIPVKAGIENDFKVNPDLLQPHLSSKTKMVIFSSPCNPTGSVYRRGELKALANCLREYPDLIVVSDEIYEYINFIGKHHSIGEFPEIKNQVATVNGFSKGFAMTGWRLGYMAAPKPIAAACAKIQGNFTSGAASFSQIAGAFALNQNLEEPKKMRDAFKKRKDLMVELLTQIPGLETNDPEGAFYIFPRISSFFGSTFEGETIKNSEDFATFLIKVGNVATVAGSAFGDDSCIRLSYAANEKELRQAVVRIGEAVEKLTLPS